MTSLLERYASKLKGVRSCFDRGIIHGTLPGLCYAAGMTAYLKARGVRIFDYPKWAEPWRALLRTHVDTLAAAEGLTIEFIKKGTAFRTEDRIQQILATRGSHPGLVHIFSAMEPGPSYKPWHDKQPHQTFLKPDSGQCLHYDFYFIDPALGRCYLRLPTWCPFRLQFSFNGHKWLAAQLRARGITDQQVDTAFVDIADCARAQALADDFRVGRLHAALERFAQR